MNELEKIRALLDEVSNCVTQLLITGIETTKQPAIHAPIMYTFTFIQDGKPLYHSIRAQDIAEAFVLFGRLLLENNIKVSHICYGTYLEMEYAEEEIRQWWDLAGKQ